MNVRLVDIPLHVFEALRDGDAETARDQLGLDIPPDFLAAHDVWTYMSGLRSDPANVGWTMNAIVRDGVIVGNAGFKGAPADGEVELGYTVLEAHRRQGIAVAATRLLVERGEREPTVSRVIAAINPLNTASIAVVAAAAFVAAPDRIHPRWGRQLIFAKDVGHTSVPH
ncbi:hypothetical protein GCM10022234_24270 [Aeromicrobium panaciterrae]|uniref:GNAT family N-acetyltransferase n=1 Tax=Aeromicrobium panaciterrae TaxID=363861 RepID=UPI0031D3470F